MINLEKYYKEHVSKEDYYYKFYNELITKAEEDKKLIEGFIDFYKQVYVLNDFSFSSIASENTKEEKKEILIKGLEIVKKSLVKQN